MQNLHSFQVYLLRYALFNFPNAKRVIYSTCSLHPEENEEVIDEVLADIGNAYRLVPVRELLKNNWTNFSSKKYNCGDTCLYSKPDDDFCNGFFVAVFERNLNATLPKCQYKGGNEYRNLINTNLNVKKDDMAEIAAYKQQKCKEKKKKKKDISTTMDERKISTNIVEFVIPEAGSKDKVKAKTNEKEVKKMDVCSNLSSFNHKLNESKEDVDIQKEMLKETEVKRSWKKKSKRKSTFQLEINDVFEADYDKKIQNNEIETELSKIKEEKKTENKEIIKINEIHFRKEKQDKDILSVTSKKRKRNKDHC